MPGSHIYLREGDRLVPLIEAAYLTENDLQGLLERHPELLRGDSDASGTGWLLIRRELGIAGAEGGSDRWSLDHLFVDRRGVPTLVEVKRSSDTRIRREVVGQMLDYAANAVAYSSVERLRERFAATCSERGEDPDLVVGEFAGVEADAFWATVRENLDARNIRIVFVADEIPSELRAIVEFLNEQMTTVEVLALEVKQYVGEGRQTLVPRLIGQTQAARAVKRRPPARRWDEESWLSALAAHGDDQDVAQVRRVLEWADAQTPPLVKAFGTGAKAAACFMGIRDDRGWCFPFSIFNGERPVIQVDFGTMRNVPYPPFHLAAKREELAARLEQGLGVTIDRARLSKYPSFSITALRGDNLERFLDIFRWSLAETEAEGLAYREHETWRQALQADDPS